MRLNSYHRMSNIFLNIKLITGDKYSQTYLIGVDMKSISIILGVSLVSSFCFAQSTIIPGIDDAYFQGENTYHNGSISPENACNVFNQKVSVINKELSDKYPGTEIIQNLCKHLRIRDHQIENEIIDDDKYYTHSFRYWWSNFSSFKQVKEIVDVERTIDILIFSGLDQTNYVMLVDGSATLANQKIVTWNHKVPSDPIYQGSTQVKPIITSWGPFNGESLKSTFDGTNTVNLLVDESVFEN